MAEIPELAGFETQLRIDVLCCALYHLAGGVARQFADLSQDFCRLELFR